MSKQYTVATPIELPGNGKTIWVNVGRGFEGEGNKYAVKISLSAIPLTMFKGEPIELFLFEAQENQQPRRRQEPSSTKAYRGNPPPDDDGNYNPPLPGDDDVPF